MKVSVDQNLAVLPKHCDTPWRFFFWEATKPYKASSEFAQVAHGYQRLLMAELVRKKWDSRIHLTGLKREQKEQIEAQGEVLHRLLNLISETFLLTPCGYEHPAFWLSDVWMEFEVAFWMQVIGNPTEATKTKIIAKARSQNSALTNYENPFTQSATALLFDRAIAHADRLTKFNKDSYRPFLRARKSAVTQLAESKIAVFRKTESGGSEEIRQGRRKKSVFETLPG